MVGLSASLEVSEKELFVRVIRDEFGPMKPALCKFALELLDQVPAYFWEVSASATGKFHPEFGLGEGGLARHTLMVYRWMKCLLLAGEDPSDYAPGMALAALFHDCFKRGNPDGDTTHTAHEHPILAAKFVYEASAKFVKENADFIEATSDDTESFQHDIAIAMNCIQTHMGKWNTDPHSEVRLPKPKDAIAMTVHMADYCASRKFTTFDREFFFDLWNRVEKV